MLIKMRKLLIYLLFAGFLAPATAREVSVNAGSGCDETLNQYSFNGAFAIFIRDDETSNYFMVDGAILPSRFERIYFMELSFCFSELVNMGFNPDCERISFKADKRYDRSAILSRLTDCKDKTRQISGVWSNEQKIKWLQEHDKYK